MKKEQENKKEISSESINKALMGLVDFFHQEENEFYKELSKDIKATEIENYEDFYRKLVRPAEKYWSGFIRTELSENKDMNFFLVNSSFIEQNFKHWIEKKEGMPCCSDKSRTIMKRLFNWFKDDKEIVFDKDEEYTYHHPKKVFTTHDEIISFYDALHYLYYGNPNQYLSILSKMLQK